MKSFLIIGGVVIVFFLALFLGKNLFLQKVGDIKPAFLPSNNKLSVSSADPKTGQVTKLPLNVPTGYKIGVFASSLGRARDITFSKEGTLIVSDMDGRVIALPDKDNNGVADSNKDLLRALNRPHGLAFYQGKLYVAEEEKVTRYNFDEDRLTATLDKKILDLPKGGRHFTRSLVFDDSGRLYISLGSTCDVCIEKEPWIAAVIATDSDGNNPKVFSKGLRNAVFLNLKDNQVYATEMGRDFLGDDLPPDEINRLDGAGDFGWPNCYGTRVPDKVFNSNLTDADCANTVVPVYQIPAHSAPLGLQFINSKQFPEDYQGDLLISYHGSWNRSTPTGYKIVKVDVKDGKFGLEEDFLTGFLDKGSAAGRPVDIEFDKEGSLFISDDKAGNVYKVVKD